MAINTVYQPPAGLMGEYAYQTSAVKQVRDNLDTSIARTMQAQQFNAGQRMNYAQMEQRNQQYYDSRQQQQQQFDANRFDRNQQFQQQQTQSLMQDYNKSRSDFDDVLEDGMKNGWLKLEPEQKQEIRKLAAADSEIMQRQDLDDTTRVRMLQAVQAQRRNIIPSVVPAFDRPSKTYEMAEESTFIIGEDGVARAPVPGQKLGENDSVFFMGKRSGEAHPMPMERAKKAETAKPVSDKYWSPELDYSAKYAKSVEQLNDERKIAYDGYKAQFDEAAAILKDPLQMGDLKVAGPDIQPRNGRLRLVGERMYELTDAKERVTYQNALRLLNTPGVAYTKDDVARKIQENDSDYVSGQAGGQEDGTPDPAYIEQILQDKPPGVYTIGGMQWEKF